MEQNKKILLEIFKKLGEKCTSCGRFFIGAAIEASTESGNYGVHLEGIGNYPLSCVKCPECAMECYNNFDGLAPCDEDNANLEEEFFLDLVSFYEQLIEKVKVNDEKH